MAQKLTISLLDKLNKELKKHRVEPTTIKGRQYYVTPTKHFSGRIKKDGSLDMRYSMQVFDMIRHEVYVHRKIKGEWKWLKLISVS